MLSRRQFLQFAGLTLMGSSLPGMTLAGDTTPIHGRALNAAPVFSVPSTQTPPIRHLWPDSVVTLTEANSGWFRSDAGFIQRSMIQPVNAAIASTGRLQARCWAEVTAAVAPVWRWCSASAPLVTRIGHGGVARVIDTLPDGVGIADEYGNLLGWSQSTHWGAVAFNTERIPLDLVIDNQILTIHHQNQVLARTAVAHGQHLPTGTFPITHGDIGGLSCCPAPGETYYGASWQLWLGSTHEITSVYWHNRFGESVPGPAVQITPVVGRWLYQTAADGSTMTIRRNI